MVILGSIPGNRQAISYFATGKVLHFVAYSVLTMLIFFSMTSPLLKRALMTWLVIAFLAAVDEAIQGFFPYRTAAISDWAFDMLAAIICIIALTLYVKLRERRS